MGAVWFLVIALAVGSIGSIAVALWHREPKVQQGEIDEFAARMKALAPPAERDGRHGS